MKKKIVYISGTRADFGLMQSTLQLIDNNECFELSIFATGMHLSEFHGKTITEIEQAGLKISARIPVQTEPSTGETMASNIGHMLIGFVEALAGERPDVVVVLGDRGEMLAGAIAAIHLNIPILHIHGGERSGTVDEPVRHAISKLSHFHCVATEDACNRLVKMGESRDRIWVTGAPGLDGLKESVTSDRLELAANEGLDAEKPIALLVYHPVLQEADSSEKDTLLLLHALRECNVQVLALMPNSDAGSKDIRMVLSQAAERKEIHLKTHLPRKAFLSWMAACDVMIGNSSSGIIEAATFGTPVINIGTRQNLRERNANVMDVALDASALKSALIQSLQKKRYPEINRYGDGRAGPRIVEVIESLPLADAILGKANAY